MSFYFQRNNREEEIDDLLSEEPESEGFASNTGENNTGRSRYGKQLAATYSGTL